VKSVATLIRLQRHALVERKKALVQLMEEAAQIRQSLAALEAALAHEKHLATQDPVLAQTFPRFLQATLRQRAMFQDTLADVAQRIAATEQEIAEAFRGLKAYELAEQGARARAAAEAAHREQKVLDEVGGALHHRATARPT
jgi:flagellar export protein FliJ